MLSCGTSRKSAGDADACDGGPCGAGGFAPGDGDINLGDGDGEPSGGSSGDGSGGAGLGGESSSGGASTQIPVQNPGEHCSDVDFRSAVPFAPLDRESLPGTNDNPYVLCTEVQFTAFMNSCVSGCTGTHFLLDADLDLESASYERPKIFHGVFDGGKHTLSQLDVSQETGSGLFETLYGTVRDVIFDEVTYAAPSLVAPHGVVASISYGIIEGVTISGTGTGKSSLGGVVGLANGGEIKDCAVDMNLTVEASTTQNVGLIASHAANTLVSDCVLSGTIASSGMGLDQVGGAIGLMETTTSLARVVSDVTVNVTAGGNNDHIGGLVGRMNAGIIEACRVAGAVTAAGENAGGVVGYLAGGTMQRSEASGNVSSGDAVGGLIGLFGAGTVSDAFSTGTINASLGSAGGLIGRAESGVSIARVYATGGVSGATEAGGLIGIGSASLSSSFSVASVGGAGELGAIVGSDTGTTFTDVAWYGALECTGAGGSVTDCDEAAALSDFHGVGAGLGAMVLSTWDFESDWQQNAQNYPTFLEP